MSLILTLTGMSTSGKSTLAKALTATGAFAETVSVTTRAMRPGEVNGRDYHFVSRDVFDQYVRDGVFLEHVISHHACYGTPSFEVSRIKNEGKSVVLVLEPDGVGSMHKIALGRNDNFMSVFVHASMPMLMERFFGRIQEAIEKGKEINYESEGKRLHTMLSEERGWSSRWDWDLTMMNLHLEGMMDGAIRSMVEYHERASMFKPVQREMRSTPRVECLSIEDLSAAIEDQIKNPTQLDIFYRKAISPLIALQNSIRYREGIPEPSL